MNTAGRVLVRALSFYDRFAKVLAYLGGVVIVVVMLLISVATISRYFFGNALSEATEISAYSLLLITFLGAPFLARTHGHIAVDIIRNATRGRLRKAFDVYAHGISIVVCLVLSVYSFRTAYDSYIKHEQVVDILRAPTYLLIAIIALGSFLTAISFLSSMVEALDKHATNEGMLEDNS